MRLYKKYFYNKNSCAKTLLTYLTLLNYKYFRCA